jgi:hypothetical protein
MKTKKHFGLLRLLLAVALVAWGMIQGLAQTKAAPPTKPAQPPTVAQSKTKWIKDPNSVMPMRQMTNAQRRAAATRNAARRNAAAQKRRSVPANQGVQQ